ncbi:BREX-3 system phosphatase PglZ [Paenibacillus sp. FSL L8-0641]|uniref:BREX-3 system phosphatase PglZ n=1 Tax=Paenibacillus sp. FSL L8-0641 TaxID=2921605 RepID=UPI0030F65B56
MIEWRKKVLEYFQTPFSHLTFVSDPDRLLDDEMIVSELVGYGFEILRFEDKASFRFQFESEFRTVATHRINLMIVSNSETSNDLPYDIWKNAQKIELRKSRLFPDLAPNIVHQLDARTLDLLSRLQITANVSSEKATINFILRHAYGIAYDSMHSLADCLVLIMRWHQLELDIPDVIKKYLIENIQQNIADVPVKEWIISYYDFCQYLQQEWEIFVDDNFPRSHVFWNASVRSFMSLLFNEGKLVRVIMQEETVPDVFTWGVSYDEISQRRELLKELQKQLELLLSAPTDRRSWIQIAEIYGKAKCTSLELQAHEDDNCISFELEKKLEAKFEKWLFKHYGSLVTLTDRNAPVMVHKTTEVLRMKGKEKLALIVCDGMSFVQWAQIELGLARNYKCEVYGSYAWIPTLTSVSRQSIFSGEIPRFFYNSINTTSKEEQAWKKVWDKNGVPSGFVTYEKGLGQGAYEKPNIAALTKSNTRVAGLVIDTIDQFTHNTIQGQLGMHATIAIWLKQGYLQSLLSDLLDAGYDVYLTSDHGNKESKGVGRIGDGTLPETRGERVRIYRDVVLRDRVAVQYPSKQWLGTGLPDDYHILLAQPGEAFVREGEIVVSHGGASIEEVIVPFVHIQKR